MIAKCSTRQKYPAEEKANFWARTYGAVSLWRTGRLNLKVDFGIYN